MTNTKQMTDNHLLSETQRLAREEREILTQILHHFREIDRRRLFSKLKYASLYDYATKELGYSEDQAYRRIQAMRLLKELPEIEEKINDGSLSLTHLGMAQSLFKREAKSDVKTYSKQDKLEVLKKLQKTTKLEAQKITLSLSPTPTLSVEKIRPVSNEDIEIRFTAKETLLKKIQKLKGLLAHKNPNLSLSDLIDELCELGLEKWDKSKIKTNATSKTVTKTSTKTAPARDAAQGNIRQYVWQRDQGKCQNCSSQYALEVDHKQPKALGGSDTLNNFRLLCRACNQRAAIEALGIKKMDQYLNKPLKTD